LSRDASDASAEAAARVTREAREADAPGRTARWGAARARKGFETREGIVAIAATDEVTMEGRAVHLSRREQRTQRRFRVFKTSER
jgi:hypothetical protein